MNHTKRIREEHTFTVGEKGNTLFVGLILEDGKRPVLNLPDAIRARPEASSLYLDRGYDEALIDAINLAMVEMARWDARDRT